MNGKNIVAALLVSIISVALAIGITFIAKGGNENNLAFQTPNLAYPSEIAVSETSAEVLLDPNATPTPTPSRDCTFPIDMWIQYPDAWKIDSYRIGTRTYSKKEMVDILRGNSSDSRSKLLTQIFVVVLNQQNGADATSVRTDFSQAVSWLESFPPGSNPSDGDMQKAVALARNLEQFNRGEKGPLACQYELSQSPTLTQNEALRSTRTLTVTVTRTPVRYTRIPPTYTPQPREPEQRPPTSAPPPPTLPPPPPQPTDTEVPPDPTSVPDDPPPAPDDPPTSVPADVPTVESTNPPSPTSAP